MAKLTREQIAAHAKKAGFADNEINIVVAIALAESGGDTTAHNTKPPDNSYGLMQINMLGTLGEDRRKRFNLPNNEALFDPDTNMRAAKAIKDSTGFSAWTTYTSGKYKEHLQGGEPDTGTTRAPDPGNPLLGGLNAFGDTIFKAASNFAGVIIAAVLVILGVVLLSRNAFPLGKALKKVTK